MNNECHADLHETSGSFFSRYYREVPLLLGLVLLLAVFGSLCVGAYPMSVWHSARALLYVVWPFHSAASSPFDLRELTVVKIIRPPRVLLAVLAGAGLGMAGTALQGMMRNPLVGPDIVGVTSGAAFGGVLGIALEWHPVGIVALAFCGGLLAMTFTFGLVNLTYSGNSMILILSGVFIGAFFLALIGVVTFYGNMFRIAHWLNGSFGGASWQKVAMCGIPTLLGGAVLMGLRWHLNLLSLGDLDAQSMGINAGLLRWTITGLVPLSCPPKSQRVELWRGSAL